MKVTEFRDLSADELQQRATDMDDQLFRLRIQKSMGQLEAAHKLKALEPGSRPASRSRQPRSAPQSPRQTGWRSRAPRRP